MLKQFRQKHRENHKHGHNCIINQLVLTYMYHYGAEEIKPSGGKKGTFLRVNIFGTQVIIGDTFFISYWRRDRHFTFTSKPCAGLVIGRAKAVHVPSFLSYFQTPSIGPSPGIETHDRPSLQSSALVLPHDDGLTPLNPNIHL